MGKLVRLRHNNSNNKKKRIKKIGRIKCIKISILFVFRLYIEMFVQQENIIIKRQKCVVEGLLLLLTEPTEQLFSIFFIFGFSTKKQAVDSVLCSFIEQFFTILIPFLKTFFCFPSIFFIYYSFDTVTQIEKNITQFSVCALV